MGKLLKGCPKSLFEVPRRKEQELLWPDESEQATVHSAPCPLPFLSDLKATAKVLDFGLNSSGPLVPQNLVNKKLKLKNNHHTALIFSTWKTVPNLFFPMVRKSPFLPLQSSRGWARSNVGQDTTREGQELIFYNTLVANAATIWMLLVLGTSWLTIVSKIWKVAKWVRGGPLSVVPQESQSQAGSPMSLVVGLIQKQIVKDFWQI